MRIQRTHLFSLGIATLLACAIPAFAQELNGFVQAEDEVAVAEAAPDTFENQYRIGLDCAPAPEVLRVHLRLHDDSGMMVNHVMPGSPAERAGIKRHDVIVEANGHPVASIVDLSRAVNEARDAEMSIAVIQEGQERLLKVTPEERSEDEIDRIRNGFGRRLGQGAWPPGLGPDFGQRLQEQLDRAMGQIQQAPFGFRQFGPGILLDDEDVQIQQQIPNGMKMQIERNNNGPARITIERGGDKWEVTENDVDQLPDDIRPMVENMLNGRRFIPSVPQRPARPRANEEKVQDRFDGLELKIEELQDAIRSIQGDR